MREARLTEPVMTNLNTAVRKVMAARCQREASPARRRARGDVTRKANLKRD